MALSTRWKSFAMEVMINNNIDILDLLECNADVYHRWL